MKPITLTLEQLKAAFNKLSNELRYQRADGHLFVFRWTRNPEARALMVWEMNILCATGEIPPGDAQTLYQYVRSK